MDLTGNTSKVELKSEIEEKDVTAFNPNSTTDVWTELLGGLASTTVEGEGQWEAGDASRVDDALWSARGGVGPLTVCLARAADGALAWVTKSLTASYGIGGQVGDVALVGFLGGFVAAGARAGAPPAGNRPHRHR